MFKFFSNTRKNSLNQGKLVSVLNPSSYDPATGVMDEIINSGHLDLIKNKNLKDKISNWSRVYEDAEEDVF